jgi:DNA-binding MarR family transcriptional regulator
MSEKKTGSKASIKGKLTTELAPSTLVLRRFRVVFNAVRTHFQQVEKIAGIGGAQVWALSVVRDSPQIGVTELGLAMDIHQSTASNLVKTLVKRGLIQTSKSEEDRRSVRLMISSAGKDILKRVPGPYEGVLPMALNALPEKTLARLDKDLAQVIAAIQADESAGGIPLANL